MRTVYGLARDGCYLACSLVALVFACCFVALTSHCFGVQYRSLVLRAPATATTQKWVCSCVCVCVCVLVPTDRFSEERPASEYPASKIQPAGFNGKRPRYHQGCVHLRRRSADLAPITQATNILHHNLFYNPSHGITAKR